MLKHVVNGGISLGVYHYGNSRGNNLSDQTPLTNQLSGKLDQQSWKIATTLRMFVVFKDHLKSLYLCDKHQ